MTAQNPWGMTAAEVRAVEAVIAHESYKAAARSIQRSPKTIEAQFCRVKERMGVKSKIAVALTYDRWSRANEVAA